MRTEVFINRLIGQLEQNKPRLCHFGHMANHNALLHYYGHILYIHFKFDLKGFSYLFCIYSAAVVINTI